MKLTNLILVLTTAVSAVMAIPTNSTNFTDTIRETRTPKTDCYSMGAVLQERKTEIGRLTAARKACGVVGDRVYPKYDSHKTCMQDGPLFKLNFVVSRFLGENRTVYPYHDCVRNFVDLLAACKRGGETWDWETGFYWRADPNMGFCAFEVPLGGYA